MNGNLPSQEFRVNFASICIANLYENRTANNRRVLKDSKSNKKLEMGKCEIFTKDSIIYIHYNAM